MLLYSWRSAPSLSWKRGFCGVPSTGQLFGHICIVLGPPSPAEMFLSLCFHTCFDNSKRIHHPNSYIKVNYSLTTATLFLRVQAYTLIESYCVFIREGKRVPFHFIHLQNHRRQGRRCSSEVGHLPTRCEDQGLTPVEGYRVLGDSLDHYPWGK